MTYLEPLIDFNRNLTLVLQSALIQTFRCSPPIANPFDKFIDIVSRVVKIDNTLTTVLRMATDAVYNHANNGEMIKFVLKLHCIGSPTPPKQWLVCLPPKEFEDLHLELELMGLGYSLHKLVPNPTPPDELPEKWFFWVELANNRHHRGFVAFPHNT